MLHLQNACHVMQMRIATPFTLQCIFYYISKLLCYVFNLWESASVGPTSLKA